MKLLAAIVIVSISSVLFAQNWKRVFVAPNVASAGYFHNENEGCIGTGYYLIGGPAQIYFTTDGGKTWTKAALPNPQLTGQVTDIYFRDRSNGWATIKNEPEAGWTGVYKTSDGGRTWMLASQASYPTSIRETARGVFITDRLNGILRSTNGGTSFTVIDRFSGALGIDFIDDNIGIHSGESILNSPIKITTDGGTTWADAIVGREAWTPFADPTNGRMFFASERDNLWPPAEGTIGMTTDKGATFSHPRYFAGNGITGGIAGSRVCRSVVYVQGQDTAPGFVKGLLRSTDNGNNWVDVGGPSNYNDTRFAVTGRGAVVYAFDKSGGVWKTTNGGDGTLTSSVRSSLVINSLNNVITAKLCESATFRIPLRFTGCEQIRITGITFDEELVLIKAPQILAATAPKYDTLTFRFIPEEVSPHSRQIRISFVRADGVAEDTTIFVTVEGLAIPDKPLVTATGNSRTLSFGDISICGGDSSAVITVTNSGCAQMRVTSLSTSDPAYTLLSAFKPFTLDPGTSRKFLVYFKPQLPTSYTALLRITTSFGADSIALTGTGIQGARSLRLTQPAIDLTLCDTAEYLFVLKNISCSELKIDSLGVDSPFELLTVANGQSLATDSTLTLRVRLVPRTVGTFPQSFRIYSAIKGERFDTTITVVATISAGSAVLALPNDVIDFHDVSTCSFKVDSIAVGNAGCDSLRAVFVQGGAATDFTLLDPSAYTLPRDQSTLVRFRFKPSQLGPQSTTFTLSTNAENRTIVLRGNGIAGNGTVEGQSTDVGTLLTCEDTTFTLYFTNNSCDTVFFDSVVYSGAMTDYAVDTFTRSSLAVGESFTLGGVFTPRDNGPRPATAVYYFHSRSGSVFVVPFTLTGSGIKPPSLTLSMPPSSVTIPAGSKVTVPIDLLGATAVPITSLLFSVETNQDFAELQDFDLSPAFASIASSTTNTVNGISMVTVNFNAPTVIGAGQLGELNAIVYLTDTMQASILLTNFTLTSSQPNTSCIPSDFDSTIITLSLDPQCGDLVLSAFLNRGALVKIESIIPNPSSGQIAVSLSAPNAYAESCVIELYDAQGKVILAKQVEQITPQAIPLSVQGGSGLYHLRVTSPGGSVSRSVRIVR